MCVGWRKKVCHSLERQCSLQHPSASCDQLPDKYEVAKKPPISEGARSHGIGWSSLHYLSQCCLHAWLANSACASAVAAPDEYAAIWHHCLTLYQECLKALQIFFDQLPNDHEGSLAVDLVDTLRSALRDVEDSSMRCWRVILLSDGVTHGASQSGSD
jgi:hypothetical protein